MHYYIIRSALIARGHLLSSATIVPHSIVQPMQGSGIGHTALHWCSAKGYMECLQWLLQQGADVNSINAEYSTPLHAAAANGQESVLKCFLDLPEVNCELTRTCTACALAASHKICCISSTVH